VCLVKMAMRMPREEERVKNPKMRWYFAKEELANSPSRREHGVEPDKELSYRQQAANMIQDMGQRLNVNQLCINTAIVYMHRFYCVHSFKTFHRHLLATAALFLAAKNEEQPRKLQYVAQASYACAYKDQPMLDIQSQAYTKLVEDITYYELLLLETLGFEVNVDHPHPHVVKCMQFLKASKDLAQMAYFMAHNSLLLTTFCLEHSPSTVACVCIHLSCRWKGLDIPRSSDGKSWWEYIDHSINRTKLDGQSPHCN
jgi:cyclin T